MTVTAWVRLDDTADRCGIISYLSDERSQSQGWILGYNQRMFTFSLSAGAGTEAPHRLTTIASRGAIKPAAGITWPPPTTATRCACMSMASWKTNRKPNRATSLIRLAGLPDRRHGQIAAAMNLIEGALFEAKAYARASAGREIQAVAKKNENLIAWAADAGKGPDVPGEALLAVRHDRFDHRDVRNISPRQDAGRVRRVAPAGTTGRNRTGPQLISEVTLTGLKPATRYFYRVVVHRRSGQEIRGPLILVPNRCVRKHALGVCRDRRHAAQSRGDAQVRRGGLFASGRTFCCTAATSSTTASPRTNG